MMALTPDLLLGAYAVGLFPMGEDRNDPRVHWIDPRERGVLPLDAFHVPRSLRKVLRRGRFTLTCDRAFGAVITACAEPAGDRVRTWLNDDLIRLYCEVHRRGHAHSIEAWEGEELVGGLYGVSLGAAFFGESMFSRTPDASKAALVELVGRLRAARFLLLDTQFVTAHLLRFGAVEISRADYRHRLRRALRENADFPTDDASYWGLGIGIGSSGGGTGSVSSKRGRAQSTTQTS